MVDLALVLVIVSLSIAIGMALGRFAVQTSELYNKPYNKTTKRKAELADYMRTVRALDATVEDLRMYAEQDACEIERLRQQLALADAVLGSEPVASIIADTKAVHPAVLAYWESYGTTP